MVQKRFGFPEGRVELYAEKVATTRGLCAMAQAESLRYTLLGGLTTWRACYGVPRFIMESGNCEVMAFWETPRTEGIIHEACGRPDDSQCGCFT